MFNKAILIGRLPADPELKRPAHRLLRKKVRELFQENGALFS